MADQENKDQQGQQQQGGDTKKYDETLTLISRVVGGKQNLFPKKKIDADTTAAIVAELFGEDYAELVKQTKEGLKNLLKKHVTSETEIATEEKKLEKLKADKRKEFVVAAGDWLRKVDQAGIQQTSYEAALETAFKQTGSETTAAPAEGGAAQSQPQA